MTRTFDKFSDAARLYVENYEVVRQIARLFDEDLAAFSAAVQSRVQAHLGANELKDWRTKEYCNWWTEWDGDTRDDEVEVPYVWYSYKSMDIVSPGEVKLVARYDGNDNAVGQACDAIGPTLLLPDHCKLYTSRLYGGRFVVNVSLSAATDPVEATAEPVLLMLRELQRVDRALAVGV